MALGFAHFSLDGNEGTLNPHHRRLNGGGDIRVPELYDVPLVKHANDPTQPENWIIDATVPWARIAPWPITRLRETYESPRGLWNDPGGKSDRVSVEYLSEHQPGQSICVIPLIKPAIHADQYKNGRHRLHFAYEGVDYDLGITDPLLPQHADGALVPTAACISLTPPFKGYHYKLVATLFWPDA